MAKTTTVNRREFLAGTGMLIVSFGMSRAAFGAAPPSGPWPEAIARDAVDSYLAIGADGRITAFNGHVDLGTGVRTALGQIVAEELDVAFGRVTLVLGDTDKTPYQGPTTASDTIQVTAVPLRRAAAEARRFLLARGAAHLDAVEEDLIVEDGVISATRDPEKRVSYAELIGDQRFNLSLPATAPVKPPSEYKLVGRPVPRVDIPAKVTGALTFVHDLRCPGMLHGRVVRPPFPGVDTDPIGASLVAVDEASVAHIPGLVKVVTVGDFVGVVAEREENAIRAARELKVTWKPWENLPDLSDLDAVLRSQPTQTRTLRSDGDMGPAFAGAKHSLSATYIWPYQMHGSIGPSCAVAEFRDGRATIWSGTQNPHELRGDIARLLKMPKQDVRVIRMGASGCYGRNCADDAAADAALLAKAVNRPVRVQLMRNDEHGWEPKGAAQLIDIKGALDAELTVTAYDVGVRYPSGAADTLPLLLTGAVPAKAVIGNKGDRTAVPPYKGYRTVRAVVNDMATIVRAAWMRGVSALPNVFAHESFVDELAAAARIDPIAFRLRNLDDDRGVAVIKAAAEKAGWTPRPSPKLHRDKGKIARGRGVAYARYTHGTFPGSGSAWTAWVAEVAVHTKTGEVTVERVVVAQDCGLMINPAGVRHQVHGNIIQSVGRVLMEEVSFTRSGTKNLDWASYPILTFDRLPQIDIVLIERPEEPPLGVGEASSVPSAAAIANAIFDATGARLRQVPFTPARVKAALEA